MALAKASDFSRTIAVALMIVCCLAQLSTSMPRRSRQPVTHLKGKVPRPLVPTVRRSPRGELLPRITGGTDVTSLRSGSEDSLETEEIDEGFDEGDYDYEDNNVYQFIDFWDSILQYVDSTANDTNVSLSNQLVEVNDKVGELETQLASRDGEIAYLREAVEKLTEKTKDPTLGDVRLIDQENGANETRGKLLFFAGERIEWGYVCDDMFSSVEATVACRQLGYSSGQVHVPLVQTFIFDPQPLRYSIVLDDVSCEAEDISLLSCRHLPIGVHNCGPSEAVRVKCFR